METKPALAGRPLRLARLAVLTFALAACGGQGLGSSEYLWCKEHLAAVDASAESLQVAKVQTNVQEPTWYADYVNSTLSLNNSVIVVNADFIASCNAAADKRGVAESRQSWCLSDGLGDAWDAAVSLGLVNTTQAETFAYRALPLGKRVDNDDFVRACKAAFAARTS